jgi:hypothetical protein
MPLTSSQVSVATQIRKFVLIRQQKIKSVFLKQRDKEITENGTILATGNGQISGQSGNRQSATVIPFLHPFQIMFSEEDWSPRVLLSGHCMIAIPSVRPRVSCVEMYNFSRSFRLFFSFPSTKVNLSSLTTSGIDSLLRV